MNSIFRAVSAAAAAQHKGADRLAAAAAEATLAGQAETSPKGVATAVVEAEDPSLILQGQFLVPMLGCTPGIITVSWR
jgi:hypothetical protein